MRILVEAWRLREAAREALSCGETGPALEWAQRAEGLHSTAAGQSLCRLAAILPPP
jgi:hypothetical protein